ncbi:ABC transporter permease [Methanocella sp. MCL-LM]|uniref:ABC transporter permease n=1 Tax=Methanocella sp. MCL-LM TaxID=3412035 RepID=UPI003C75C436
MAISGKEIQNIQTIAVKEFKDNLKSKRFLILGVFYFGFALLLTFAVVMMTRSAASLEAFKPDMVLSIMSNLNIVLALLAVIVSSDTLSMERKDRTLLQLLSKPIDRSSVILGKFLGCLSVVAALFLGSAIFAYLATAVLSGKYPAAGDLLPVAGGLLSMVLMLSVYVAIGVLISTFTKNPFISIIGSLMAWIGLWFSSTIGNIVGYNVASGGAMFFLGGFDDYPIYAKILVWIDPLSHDIMSPLLNPAMEQAAVGMPLWANIVFLVVYTAVLLILAILLFENQDLSA